MRRPTLHLGNDPPAGNHTQDSGASRTPFASTSPGACCLTGTSFRLRIIVVLTTMENSCVHLCPHRRPSAALIFSAHRKKYAQPGKPPPERSGGLHNAPTVTLPACSFASRARRCLPSPAYFAYASLEVKDRRCSSKSSNSLLARLFSGSITRVNP